jgi:hypothetical protein
MVLYIYNIFDMMDKCQNTIKISNFIQNGQLCNKWFISGGGEPIKANEVYKIAKNAFEKYT